MISPLTAEALTPVVERALAEGIPVVTLDRMVDTCVSVHVGAENLPIGSQAAEFLAERLNGEGQIIEIQGTAGASATVDRHNGFAEVLQNYPNLKVVAEQTADYSTGACDELYGGHASAIRSRRDRRSLRPQRRDGAWRG